MGEFVTGTCTSMCPKEEILTRESQGQVHFLEMRTPFSYSDTSYSDPHRMVKCYRRSAAGVDINQADHIRPPHVLERTLHYLLTEIVCDKRVPFSAVYEFLNDRLRSIRQDMILQQPFASDCIPLLEPMVRFYVYAAYRLCNSKVNQFDPVLNYDHLLSCLKWLLNLYDISDHSSESRAEMEALYLIVNLGHTEALMRSITLPKHNRHGVVLDVEKLSLSWCFGNYYSVCKSVDSLPVILSVALVSTQLAHIRRFTLRVMCTAYSSRNLSYPLSDLTKLLLYDTIDEAVKDCEACGITIEDGGVHFMKTSFNENPDSKAEIKRLVSIDKRISVLSIPDLLLHSSPL